ncbi:MAG TPA: SPW repeat protein [Vicinamibacterales bacterium]|nr:SPW repeat protein [Vicinamibacterales bacterium]
MRWASWVSVVLGIWLIVAPFVVGYRRISAAAATEDAVMGILILAVSLWAALAAAPPAAASWIVFLFGLWVVVAPFAIGDRSMATSARMNDVIVGALTLIMSVVRATAGAPRPAARGGTIS